MTAAADESSRPPIASVLRVRAFRTLWVAFGLSSLGDWIGLLALTAMAKALAGGGYAAGNYAIGVVLLARVLPALLLAPFAGVIADKLDRRNTMIVGDLLRAGLFATIPIFNNLVWVLVATALVELVSLVWQPAKEAAVPNLIPRNLLEAANTVGLVTTYGSAVPAAAIFTVLSLASKWLGASSLTIADIALFFNAATFAASAVAVVLVREIKHKSAEREEISAQSGWKMVVEGWRFVTRTPLIRGLVAGICGAFAAGAVVIGLGRTYVEDLHAGDAGYGVLFGAVFTGLAVGMLYGPRLLAGTPRVRQFSRALLVAGAALILMSPVQHLELAVILALALGAAAGTGWVACYTLLGLEVSDEMRGRTFAFVGVVIRLVLSLTLAAAPFAAALFGAHTITIGSTKLTYNGAAIVVLIAGVVVLFAGFFARHQFATLLGKGEADQASGAAQDKEENKETVGGPGDSSGMHPDRGLFIALEGGEGVGKTTQTDRLCGWLRDQGYEVVRTREPGGTDLGARVREIVLDPATGQISGRAEALLYAADKAQHVEHLILPALERGEIVVTDRYVDSALAYQGSARGLERDGLDQVNRWATRDLRPRLTVLIDLDPAVGHGRFTERDRIESEGEQFHITVRDAFVELAHARPEAYLVVDGSLTADEIQQQIRERVSKLVIETDLVRSGSGDDR